MPENSSVLLLTISCERTQKLFLYLVTQSQQLCSAAVWKATVRISRRHYLLKPSSNWLMPFDSRGLLSDMKMKEKIMYYSIQLSMTPQISYCVAIFIDVYCFFIDSFLQSLIHIKQRTKASIAPTSKLTSGKAEQRNYIKADRRGLGLREWQIGKAQSSFKKTDWQAVAV